MWNRLDAGWPLLLLLHIGRARRTDETGVLVGMAVLAWAAGKRACYREGDVPVQEMLAYVAEALGSDRFEWTLDEWSPPGGRNVSTAAWSMPEGLREAFDGEAEYRIQRGRVVDVRAPRKPLDHHRSMKLAQDEHNALAAAAMERARAATAHIGGIPRETEEMLDYFHRRNRTFYAHAVEAADLRLHLGSDPIRFDAEALHEEVEAIRRTLNAPRPVYRPGIRTQRLVPAAPGLATIRREDRRLVLARCIEADMSAAQFTLLASLWDVPEARAWLADLRARGVSMWDDLGAFVASRFPEADLVLNGAEDDDEGNRSEEERDKLKAVCKALVQPLLFGQRQENLRALGNDDSMTLLERFERNELRGWLTNRLSLPDLAPDPDVAPFVDALLGFGRDGHPALAAMYRRREERRAEIVADGGLVDVFGRHYRLGADLDGRPVTDLLCLAAEAQAAEHYVMYRVARVVMDHEAEVKANPKKRLEAAIMLWQSDGVSLWVRKPEAAQLWIDRLRAGLAKGCRGLEAETGCPEILSGMSVDYAPAGWTVR